MTTNKQILKKSLTITTSQTGLWALGIFLSSGFNIHWWYLLSWFKQSGLLDQATDANSLQHLLLNHHMVLWAAFAFGFAICLIGFNLIKLWFFAKVHENVHTFEEQKCFLCKRLKIDHQPLSQLILRKVILWRTCLASLITVGFTVATLTGFRYLLDQTDGFYGQSIILALCLVFILVGISLWNMLSVLFIFWYEQSFAKAANLSIEMLFTKVHKILGFVVLLTIIFLLAISAGSLIIWQLPVFFSALPHLISDRNFIQSSQFIISALAGVLFLAWLIINNVFFNVSMLILFDQQIKTEGFKEALTITAAAPAKHAVYHTFID